MKTIKNNTILLGSSIIERYPKNLIPNSLNLGISGLTSDELIQKYYLLPPSNQYQNIVLYIGSNDITHTQNTVQQIYTNITEFILHYLPQNKNIILIAILKSPKRTTSQINKIIWINRKLREFSQKYPNIHFCNLNRELSSPSNYLPDKVHISEKGYSIMSNKVLQMI